MAICHGPGHRVRLRHALCFGLSLGRCRVGAQPLSKLLGGAPAEPPTIRWLNSWLLLQLLLLQLVISWLLLVNASELLGSTS